MSDFDFTAQLLSWYHREKRDLPWRHTLDPYAIWVSEIMLQQTRVEAVKPYYHRFLKELPDIAHLAAAPEEKLYKLWEGLGYYSRVRNMKRAATTCMQMHQGALPQSHKELLALCGIGEYTAAAIASIAFGQAVVAIDGNVLRVLCRFLAIDRVVTHRQTRKEIHDFLAGVIPEDAPGDFNSALMELGATLCGPDKAPRCGGCPLLAHCRAFKEKKTETLPVRAEKAKKKVDKKTLLIIRTSTGIALQKRAPTGLLAGLWEPPSLSGHLKEDQIRAHLEGKMEILSIKELAPARHVFTHVIWEMHAFEITAREACDFLFFDEEAANALAIPSAFASYKDLILKNPL